jgi:EAL domain-containing protein (putative c-di-GMP-specific phosphodiesterase class I)
LKHHFEDDERIGYLGSGTFLLVLPHLETSDENVSALLESTVFKEAFSIEGRRIRVSCTVGMARYPVDGEEGSELVHRAEAALKLAKEAGEQALHYEAQMRTGIAERLSLEHRLRIALDERQFLLHYQPQLSVTTGRIESVEALLRWKDPEEGLILPHRFLPLLESSGLIVRVGEWVLRKAAADCRRWRDMKLGPLRVAVNVSPLQLRRRGFVDQVLECVKGTEGAGYGIDLEITETSLLQDMDGTVRKLRELRAAGVRIAIDDFGTGYSSLGLLSALPVDLLKIDRSFISGLPADRASKALVSSIVGLAFAFDLLTVAEGVETEQQLEMLRTLKCHQSQGFLHCAPVADDQLEPLLEKYRREHS